MTPNQVLERAIRPAFALLPSVMRSREAEAFALAICIQETGLRTRVQYKGGPARGLSQFERIAVRHVLTHPRTSGLARQLCVIRDVPPLTVEVHAAFTTDDILCLGFTRLNLWTSPNALPRREDMQGAWREYLGVWRPGKPRPAKWPAAWLRAWGAIDTTPHLT